MTGIAGRATPEGTGRYRSRFERLSSDHFRRAGDLWLSSIGVGTYLGEADSRDDAAYRASIAAAVRGGCNIVDTAINYRFQRSERSAGLALADLFAGGFRRDEVIVATKGGFIPFDGSADDPGGWFRRALLEPGIAAPDDVVANCHIMTPGFLEAQIDWSLSNLGLETIDVYYLHNPETQLTQVDRPEFLMRVKAAFEMLERQVESGRIGVYGAATWDGFRVPPGNQGHLSLAELTHVAGQVAGERHHFRAIQLPVNLAMPEACLLPTQKRDRGHVPLLEAAVEEDMMVMASGSLLQGRIVGALAPGLAERIPGAGTDAQRGLQVVRSVPGLAAALVGMKRIPHVEENLALAAVPRMPGDLALAVLGACGHG